MKDFHNKVAAITGAGSGIGRALALALARSGCRLALSDRNEVGLAQTAAEVARVAPGLALTRELVDVADRAQVYDWAERVVLAHGGVNLIFNNAGVALSSTVEGMSYDDFEWLMNINFWGVVYGTKAFLPHLRASGEGHIVNISSLFGIFAQPGMSAYNASKYAVRGFTESLRQEFDLMKCGVSATSVHPGGIKTNIAQASRVSPSLNGLLVHDEQQGRDAFDKLLITTPDKAAQVILKGVRRNSRRVLIGRDAYAGDLMARLLPSAYQPLVVGAVRRTRKLQPEPAIGNAMARAGGSAKRS